MTKMSEYNDTNAKYGPLVVSINGYHLSPQQAQAKVLEHPLVGGVILFSQNYADKQQLKELTTEIKTIADEHHKKLMIMVDHEGGFVQRFRTGFSAIPAAKVLGEIYDINSDTALIYADQLGMKVGEELKSVGIDVILGPVVDLDNGNSVVSGLDRSFHQDPKVVSQIAGAYIHGLQDAGMQATLKHFPGHGADIGDSHKESPIDNRTWEELNTLDLLPFKNLIDTQTIGAVMPAHVKYPSIDSENTAGTSEIWLKEILRTELNFNGVIISDCLSMVGAGDKTSFEKIMQVLEFSDLALLSHQTPGEYFDILKMMEGQGVEWSQQSQHRVENWVSDPLQNELVVDLQVPQLVQANVLPPILETVI